METVGIRELKQNASEVVARVERGVTIDVTLRGRPVARITPLPRTDGRSRWTTGADLAAAVGHLSADTTGWSDDFAQARLDDPLESPWADE